MFLIVIYACAGCRFNAIVFVFLIGVSCFHVMFIYKSLGLCHVNVRLVYLIIVLMILILVFVIKLTFTLYIFISNLVDI